MENNTELSYGVCVKKKKKQPELGELEQVQKPELTHNNNYTHRGTNC